MKYLTTALTVGIMSLLSSCGEQEASNVIVTSTGPIATIHYLGREETWYPYNIFLFEIDGCEYVGNVGGQAGVLAHKGNCKYCQQRLTDQLLILPRK